jgi:hypothetical protein
VILSDLTSIVTCNKGVTLKPFLLYSVAKSFEIFWPKLVSLHGILLMFNFALIHWVDEGAAPYKGRGSTRTQQECECGPAAGVPGTGAHRNFILNGQCHEIFDFWFFFLNQFPRSPCVSHEGRLKFFRNFMKIFAAQGAPDTGGKNKKIFNKKLTGCNLMHLFIEGQEDSKDLLRVDLNRFLPKPIY